MKNNEFEKFISELSPELQEKARQCADAEELNLLLAENDVELSEEALEAVAGGCSLSDNNRNNGDVTEFDCTQCGCKLYYWDRTYSKGNRYYCGNGACIACQENWLFSEKTTEDHEGTSYGTGKVKRVK